MNRDEILEKSRKENKNQDIYEQEVLVRASKYSCITAAILASIFFIVQILVGKGANFGLYAIVFSMVMCTFWAKYFALRRKHELFVAIGYTLMVLVLSISYICRLIGVA